MCNSSPRVISRKPSKRIHMRAEKQPIDADNVNAHISMALDQRSWNLLSPKSAGGHTRNPFLEPLLQENSPARCVEHTPLGSSIGCKRPRGDGQDHMGQTAKKQNDMRLENFMCNLRQSTNSSTSTDCSQMLFGEILEVKPPKLKIDVQGLEVDLELVLETTSAQTGHHGGALAVINRCSSAH